MQFFTKQWTSLHPEPFEGVPFISSHDSIACFQLICLMVKYSKQVWYFCAFHNVQTFWNMLQASNSEYIYSIQKTITINLYVWTLKIFSLYYSSEYRSIRICKSLHSVLIYVLHFPIFLKSGLYFNLTGYIRAGFCYITPSLRDNHGSIYNLLKCDWKHETSGLHYWQLLYIQYGN